MNPHLVVTRFTTVLMEPLIDVSDRLRIEADMTALAARHRLWTIAWVSGCISGAIRSLPSSDPWRRIAVTIGTRSFGVAGEHMTSTRGPFGTIMDHLDLVEERSPNFGDPLADPYLAGGHQDLGEESAAWLAAAGRGWRQSFEAGVWLADRRRDQQVLNLHGDDTPQWWPHAARALRSALFRRRCYLGNGIDQTFILHSLQMLGRADHVAAAIGDGRPVDWDYRWPDRQEIPDWLYDEFNPSSER